MFLTGCSEGSGGGPGEQRHLQRQHRRLRGQRPMRTASLQQRRPVRTDLPNRLCLQMSTRVHRLVKPSLKITIFGRVLRVFITAVRSVCETLSVKTCNVIFCNPTTVGAGEGMVCYWFCYLMDKWDFVNRKECIPLQWSSQSCLPWGWGVSAHEGEVCPWGCRPPPPIQRQTPPPPVDRQTLVKTLPCRIFYCGR